MVYFLSRIESRQATNKEQFYSLAFARLINTHSGDNTAARRLAAEARKVKYFQLARQLEHITTEPPQKGVYTNYSLLAARQKIILEDILKGE